MRLLHTADWHVGKTIGGRSRADEHEAVLAEIAGIARQRAVDLVLVAGDVFDSMAPGPDAERIVYRALLALGRVAPVVVVAGNHDNERRLAAVAPLFALAGVTVRAGLSAEPLTIPTRSGETACLALLPWLSQRHVVRADHLMTRDADELEGRFAERMRRVVAAVTVGFHDDTVNVVVGHATIAGAILGGGERAAQTIFDYWVPATVFPSNAHYVALGHLHALQQMAGAAPIYYSGSPLQLDFSERSSHGVLVVDAAPGVPARVEEVELRSGRRLRTIAGRLEDLRALAGSTGDDLLRVVLQEPPRAGLGEEVRELWPDTVVKIVVEGAPRPLEPGPEAAPGGVAPRDLFERYLAQRGVTDERMTALFDRLYEEMHEASAT